MSQLRELEELATKFLEELEQAQEAHKRKVQEIRRRIKQIAAVIDGDVGEVVMENVDLLNLQTATEIDVEKDMRNGG